MNRRFARISEFVASYHVAKDRPADLFAGVFFDNREKIKALKDKLAIEARDSLRKALVDDLTAKGYEVVSADFALGQYRGSKFMTSAKVSVKTGTEDKAKKLAGYLLKYSPKFNLKSFSDGIGNYNIR